MFIKITLKHCHEKCSFPKVKDTTRSTQPKRDIVHYQYSSKHKAILHLMYTADLRIGQIPKLFIARYRQYK